MTIGRVSLLIGKAIAIKPDGSSRELRLGDSIESDELISVAADGKVELQVNGQTILIGSNQTWVAGGAETIGQAEAVAEILDPKSVEAIQAALLAGADPTIGAEVTAAGGATGAGGPGGLDSEGSSFVRVQRVTTLADTGAIDTIGFETTAQDARLFSALNSEQIFPAAETTALGGAGTTLPSPIVTLPEAANGLSALELADGTIANVTLPTGTVAGDTITLLITKPDGSIVPVTHLVTAVQLAIGTASVLLPGSTFQPDGSYIITSTVTDQAGTVSNASDPVAVNVDTVAPGKPATSITEAGDGGVNAVEHANGVPVSVVLPAGTQPGDTITVNVTKDGTTVPVTVTVPAGSNPGDTVAVTIPATTLSPDGDYVITTTVTDQTGNVSTTSDPIEVKVDTVTPEKPTDITIPENGAGGVNPGELASDGGVPVNIKVPPGTQPGDTITLKITPSGGGTAVEIPYTVKASDTPGESVSILIPKDTIATDGNYAVTVQVSDPSGNKSPVSDPITLKVDTSVDPQAPDLAPASDFFAERFGTKVGTDTDDTTAALRPLFTGESTTAEVGSTITYYAYASLLADGKTNSGEPYDRLDYHISSQIKQLFKGQPSGTVYDINNLAVLSTAKVVADSEGKLTWKSERPEFQLNDAVDTSGDFIRSIYAVHVYTKVTDPAGNVSQLSGPLNLAISLGASINKTEPVGDPIILDLLGDGLNLIGVGAGVQFDIDGDGDKDTMGWVAPTDGFLVLQKNTDGAITADEMFGDQMVLSNGKKATSGFQALANIDSDGDGQSNGVINASDTKFKDLQVWQDLDSDGELDAGELKSLASLGITEISLSGTSVNQNNAGNLVKTTSSYKKGNTVQTAGVGDVNLQLAIKNIPEVTVNEAGIVSKAEADDGIAYQINLQDTGLEITKNSTVAIQISKPGSSTFTTVVVQSITVDIIDTVNQRVTLVIAKSFLQSAGEYVQGQFDIKVFVAPPGTFAYVEAANLAHFILDTKAPEKPSIAIPDNDGGVVNATELADGVQVNVAIPTGAVPGDTITVNVTKGGVTSTVSVKIPFGKNVGDTIPVVIPKADLVPDGDYVVTTTVTDVAGNTSLPSDAVTLKVDTTPSTSLTSIDITAISEDSGVNNDFRTNDVNGLTISGTVTGTVDGDTIEISLDGGTTYVQVTTFVAANKAWSFTEPSGTTRTNGETVDYKVRVRDKDDNVTSITDNQVVT
ncbi:MAG: retention module-containing protein, partial [Oceanospirillaceae bacterium]|nr:retention module-containing protein [Oceanospirillaceae bacterium]